MNIFTETVLALVGYTVLKHMTKSQTIAASTTAIIIWLLASKAEAGIDEIGMEGVGEIVGEEVDKEAKLEKEAEIRDILEEKEKVLFETAGDKIYIEYPGLNVWFPQKTTEEVQDMIIIDKEGNEINLSSLLDQYTGI